MTDLDFQRASSGHRGQVHRGALPFRAKIGWALGQLPIACHVGLVSFYLLYFVTDVHHVSPALAGIVLLLPRLFNIGFDPVIGTLSDRLKSRYGRRRPFLIAGAIWWGISIAFLFGVPVGSSQLHAAAVLLVAFLAVSIGQTLYHVPYSAMLAELTDRDAETISLVAWKEAVSRVGILIAASVVPILVAWFPTEIIGYRVAGAATGAIILASGLFAFFSTAGAPQVASTDSEHVTIRRQLAAVARNRPFLLLVGAYIAIILADEIFSEALVYYAVNVLGRTPAFVGEAYPISSVAAVLTLTLWNKIAVSLGKRATLFIALAGMAGAWLVILAIPPAQGWLMLPLMAIVGVFNAGLLMIPNAIVPETIEFDAARTGLRQEGATYGAWIFCQQSAMAAGGFVLSLGLTVIGYDGTRAAQTAATREGLILIIGALPAALLVIAALLARKFPLGVVICRPTGA